MRGRHRAHASQQGNALWSLVTLGLADDRCDGLADLLLHWQWPDGGWNCDRDPAADTSSFFETLLPMRGLWAHGTGRATAAARAAAEVFSRTPARLPARHRSAHPRRVRQAALPAVLALRRPRRAQGDRGPRVCSATRAVPTRWTCSSRCASPTAGRPRPLLRASADVALGNDWVDWGGTSTRRANPWVTADALAVLRAAGRLDL
jgi:hypothetical protein